MVQRNKNNKNKEQLQDDNTVKCPICGSKNKLNNNDLYVSKSELYQHYGKLIYCKSCVEKIYNRYFQQSGDKKRATYLMCRRLDIPFKYSAYEGACKDNRDWSFQQLYIGKINSLGSSNNYGLSFDDSDMWIKDDITDDTDGEREFEHIDIDETTKLFWGYGMPTQDYVFLDNELTSWKMTHKCDNRAEETLLKEICLKLLEIRKKRESNSDTSKEIKDLQDLMKTASVDPAKANSIGSGQTVDRFGVWLKDIEEKKPSDWWQNQEKYKDMDGFVPYIKNYIIRPIKNFFTGTKDFIVDGDDLSFKDVEDAINNE